MLNWSHSNPAFSLSIKALLVSHSSLPKTRKVGGFREGDPLLVGLSPENHRHLWYKLVACFNVAAAPGSVEGKCCDQLPASQSGQPAWSLLIAAHLSKAWETMYEH